jgi:hypothetical protein
MANTYDPRVADLAWVFLAEPDTRHPDHEEHEKRIDSLSCAIQQTIEDWLDSHPVEETSP